jgi:hypothetical protein
MGAFLTVSYPDVGAATPPSTIAVSQSGHRVQSRVLCEPVFLGDTLIEELAISTTALTVTFCFRNEQHVSFY